MLFVYINKGKVFDIYWIHNAIDDGFEKIDDKVKMKKRKLGEADIEIYKFDGQIFEDVLNDIMKCSLSNEIKANILIGVKNRFSFGDDIYQKKIDEFLKNVFPEKLI